MFIIHYSCCAYNQLTLMFNRPFQNCICYVLCTSGKILSSVMKMPSFRSSVTYNLEGNRGILLVIMDRAGNSVKSTTPTSSILTVRIQNSEAMVLTKPPLGKPSITAPPFTLNFPSFLIFLICTDRLYTVLWLQEDKTLQ